MASRDIKYKDVVNESGIAIDAVVRKNERYRFSLAIPFRRVENKTALVILMNPSKATEKVSDSTVNNVLARVYNECSEVSKVIIANLYPLYETCSEKLENNAAQSKVNFEKIHELMGCSDLAILGWGKPSRKSANDLVRIKYHEHALTIIEMAQESKLPTYIVGALREKLYPKHLGRLSFEMKMACVDLSGLAGKLRNKIKR